MARLTYKTGMGDYNTKESWADAKEFLIVFRKVVERLGELEDQIEAEENEELAPLPFTEIYNANVDPWDRISESMDRERWDK